MAFTTSGLSSAYNQMPDIIPSPKRDDSSSNRLEEGLVPMETEVVSKVKDIDAAIAFFRSVGVSGL